MNRKKCNPPITLLLDWEASHKKCQWVSAALTSDVWGFVNCRLCEAKRKKKDKRNHNPCEGCESRVTGVQYYLPEVCHGGGERALRGDVSRVARVMVHLGDRQRERTVCDTVFGWRLRLCKRKKRASIKSLRGRGSLRLHSPLLRWLNCEQQQQLHHHLSSRLSQAWPACLLRKWKWR